MLPEKTWKTESVLRLLLGVFGSLCVGVVIAGGLAKFNTDWSDETAKLVSMMVVTISFQGAGLLWIRNFLKEENISWRDAFGFNFQNPQKIIALGMVAGVVVVPIAWGLQQLTAWVMTLGNLHPEAQQVVQEIQKGVSPFQQIFFAVVALIAAPIVEEMLFRGIIYPTIKRAGYPKLALWGTSILFSLTHQNAPAFLALVFFAVILTLLYEKTGNLLAPMIAHGCFNAANFILLLFAKQFSGL